MEEPSRIGLTATTGAQLEELLDDLNPSAGVEGVKLIKFDLYRLAIVLELKTGSLPTPLNEKSVTNLRVVELDPNGVLATAVEVSCPIPEGVTIYEFIERLAESGIKKIYQAYQKTGQLPVEEYFEE